MSHPDHRPETQESTGGNTPPRGSLRSDQPQEPTVYRGWRDSTAPAGQECKVVVNGERLACRYDLLTASPNGFEWGFNGSGPAQLAVSILADAFDDRIARERYDEFKRDIVATLPEHGWRLTRRELEQIVDAAEVLD